MGVKGSRNSSSSRNSSRKNITLEMINGKKVVERSVARKMVNKNLKVDSHIVK